MYDSTFSVFLFPVELIGKRYAHAPDKKWVGRTRAIQEVPVRISLLLLKDWKQKVILSPVDQGAGALVLLRLRRHPPALPGGPDLLLHRGREEGGEEEDAEAPCRLRRRRRSHEKQEGAEGRGQAERGRDSQREEEGRKELEMKARGGGKKGTQIQRSFLIRNEPSSNS